MSKRTAATAATGGFAGFSKQALAFWPELAAHMTKEWFDSNKERYQKEWVAPMTALLADVAPRLTKAYQPVALGEPKVMRIHRDVRFSKDKTPYKDHIGAAIPLAGASMADGGCAAVYIHLGLVHEFVGVGSYQFSPPQLAAWRKAVGAKPGAELATVVTRLRGEGYEVVGHDDYKKVPKGFADDHPRAELLKMKGLTGSFPRIPARLILSAGFADWVVEHGARMAPLVRWLAKHVH